MDTQNILLDLVIILLSARLIGELAAYFQIPSEIGELVAGILIGPSVLGWIDLTRPSNF
jgi:Kef-type K+ transport system membrane component KefB